MSNKGIMLASEAYYGISFVVESAAISLLKSKFYGEQLSKIGVEDQQSLINNGKSILGTPIISNIVLGDSINTIFNFIDFDGSVKQANSINLECCLITLSRQKNIVETILEGRDGVVSQFISNGAYKIDITCIIATTDNSWPSSIMKDLDSIFTIPDSIPITSDLLNLFNIHSMIIKDHNMTQEEGYYNQQTITFSGISDNPINLQSVSTTN
jgi:hypothetical protein